MNPDIASALIAGLSVALVAVTVVAIVLWHRARQASALDVALLAVELEQRRKEVAALTARLEALQDLEAGLDAERIPLAATASLGPHRLDSGQATPAPRPTLITVPDLAARADEAAPAATELALRYGPIWDLAEAGVPAEAIARRTGHPIGQVELILGLRRRLVTAEDRT